MWESNDISNKFFPSSPLLNDISHDISHNISYDIVNDISTTSPFPLHDCLLQKRRVCLTLGKQWHLLFCQGHQWCSMNNDLIWVLLKTRALFVVICYFRVPQQCSNAASILLFSLSPHNNKCSGSLGSQGSPDSQLPPHVRAYPCFFGLMSEWCF